MTSFIPPTNNSNTKVAEFFQMAIKLTPDVWRNRLCFGRLLIRRNDLAEATKQLERALELNRGDPEIFRQLGHALWGLKEHQRSVVVFDRAVELAQYGKQEFSCTAKAYYGLGLMELDPNRSQAYLLLTYHLIDNTCQKI